MYQTRTSLAHFLPSSIFHCVFYFVGEGKFHFPNLLLLSLAQLLQYLSVLHLVLISLFHVIVQNLEQTVHFLVYVVHVDDVLYLTEGVFHIICLPFQIFEEPFGLCAFFPGEQKGLAHHILCEGIHILP